MNGTTLDITHAEKDLGVTVDEDLKFHKHIANAVNTASRLLGLIRKTFILLDEITAQRVFTAMVRPHLEYGNVIWHRRNRGDKLEVEKVQRWPTKLIPNISHLPYDDWLKFPKLPSLDFRKRRGDMIYVFTIMYGIDMLDPHNFFIFPPNNNTRGQSQKVFMGRCKLYLRRSVFSNRSRIWTNFGKGSAIDCHDKMRYMHSRNTTQKGRNNITGIPF